MRACAGALVDDGAQVILAACTEVPLLLTAGDLAVPLVDATQILAERAIAYARGEPLPARRSVPASERHGRA